MPSTVISYGDLCCRLSYLHSVCNPCEANAHGGVLFRPPLLAEYGLAAGMEVGLYRFMRSAEGLSEGLAWVYRGWQGILESFWSQAARETAGLVQDVGAFVVVPSSREHVRHELRVAMHCRHPNAVDLSERVGRTGGRPFGALRSVEQVTARFTHAALGGWNLGGRRLVLVDDFLQSGRTLWGLRRFLLDVLGDVGVVEFAVPGFAGATRLCDCGPGLSLTTRGAGRG